MSARSLAGCDAEQFQRHDLLIKHRHQPAHRTNEHFSALAPVHILRPIERGDFFGQSLGQNLGGGAAFSRDGAARYSPLGVLIFSSLPTSTPTFLANACAAGVGCPSLYATCADGPVTCSVISGCEAGMPEARTAKRRGVSRCEIAPAGSRRSRCSSASQPLAQLQRSARQSSAPGSLRIRFRVKSQALVQSSLWFSESSAQRRM